MTEVFRGSTASNFTFLIGGLDMKKNSRETWHQFMYDRAIGRRTVHKNFFLTIKSSLESLIKVGTFLEV